MVADSLLDIICSEIFLYHVGPALLLYIIVYLISPKVLLPILSRLVLFLVSLIVIIVCAILIWSIAYFFPNKEIKPSSPLPSRPPAITVTPPTEDHTTNLPPTFEEQDENFLTTIYRQSRPMHGRSDSRASSFAPGSSRSRSSISSRGRT